MKVKNQIATQKMQEEEDFLVFLSALRTSLFFFTITKKFLPCIKF